MKFKKTFINILRDFFKLTNIYYMSFAIPVIFFKYLNKLSFLIIVFLIIFNEFSAKIKKFKIKLGKEITTLRWVLFPSLIFLIFLPQTLVGYVLLLNLLIDKITGILRNNIKLNKIIPYTKKDFSGLFFFWGLGFLTGIIYFYFYNGYVLKSDGIAIFLTAIFIGLLESINPMMINDNISISIFGPVFMYITKFVDFHIHISGLNFVFGFIVCAMFVIILLLLDIIKFNEMFLIYGVLLILYTGLGYYLFVFNVLIFIGYGTFYKIKKICIDNEKHPAEIFININTIKNSFLISIIVAIIFIFIPSYRFIKFSLAVGLLTGLCFYTIDIFDKLWGKNFFNILNFNQKLMKTDETISIQGLLANISLSLIYLAIAYILHIFTIKEILLSLVVCNFTWYIAKILVFKEQILKLDFKNVKFLITYIPFGIMIIINAR